MQGHKNWLCECPPSTNRVGAVVWPTSTAWSAIHFDQAGRKNGNRAAGWWEHRTATSGGERKAEAGQGSSGDVLGRVLTMPVEMTAPDRESAGALLGEAVSHFHAELVETAGPATVVRLRPARAASAGWVFELLALVERWLEAHGLQVANVHHGNRSYVITAPGPERQWAAVPARQPPRRPRCRPPTSSICAS